MQNESAEAVEEAVPEPEAMQEDDKAVEEEAATEEVQPVVEQAEAEEDDDEQGEMLDLLCDQVEVEEYKETKQKELNQMKQILDQRQQKRSLIVKQKQARKLEKETAESVEVYSQLIMRDGSRKIKHDALMAKVNRRAYVPIDQVDSKEQLSPSGLVKTGKGFFTIGVVVDKSRVLESKAGKKFVILKLSDLEKYDMPKVR